MSRTGGVSVEPLRSLLDRDLDYVCAHLHDELGAMAGRPLLMTGGAGFLGYYMVQSILHWNDRVAPADRIPMTVFDNYVRGVPAWMEALRSREDLTLVRHDVREPLPAAMPDFEYVIHAAGIASPTYYRAHPLETMDANIDGLRRLLEYARRRLDQGRAFSGFMFYSSSEIYGDPAPDMIPTPEDYRGNVSSIGPRSMGASNFMKFSKLSMPRSPVERFRMSWMPRLGLHSFSCSGSMPSATSSGKRSFVIPISFR